MADAYELGFVKCGIASGDADRTLYVNDMIGLAPGGSNHVIIGPHDNLVTRSTNIFSPLDFAALASRTSYGSSRASTVDINLGTGGFEYLLAKYDGPNFGGEVWYVGGLTGTVTIPAFGDKYGISLSALFEPGSPPKVPDGGSTVVLLGVALTGLAGIRAKFRKH